MLKKILFPLYLILLSNILQSQDVKNVILLPISVVKVIYGDSCDVVISCDNIPEINKLFKGNVYGKYDVNNPERAIEIGKAIVKNNQYNQVTASIKMNMPKDMKMRIWPGDFVEIEIKKSSQTYNSIFYRLAALHIYLTDNEGNKFYSFNDLFNNDNKSKENLLLNNCLDELKKNNNFDNNNKIIKEGIFKNKTIQEALNSSNNLTLLYFLEYILENPRKYSGQKNYIKELYVEWLVNNTPIASSQLYDKLLYSKVQSDIDSAISLTSIENHKIILSQWNKKAFEMHKKFDYMSSSGFLNMSFILSQNIKQDKSIASTYYISAKIKSDNKNYIEAYNEYMNAYNHFKKANHVIAQTTSLNNACWQYIANNEYKIAEKEFKNAIKIQKKIISENNDIQVFLNRVYALTVNNYALAMHLSGKSKKSIKLFNQALQILSDDKSDISIKRQAYINYNLSKAYQQLGNNLMSEEFRKKTENIVLPANGEVEDWFFY